MEKTIEFYKSCIKKLLSAYELLKTEWSEVELIFDDERMRYVEMGIPKEKICLGFLPPEVRKYAEQKIAEEQLVINRL